jgi:hypothetical protein
MRWLLEGLEKGGEEMFVVRCVVSVIPPSFVQD